MDFETYRAESRDRWERAAAGWTATREAMQQSAAPVTMWMIDAIDPQPGQTVLELAAGLGDTGLMAAELVGPGGSVILTDGAEAMVQAAKENAARLGATNVEARAMEAEWIDLATASVDGALCRWGYMLLADPEAALRETRRVLRPDGRLALAAWDARERNPWNDVLAGILDARGLAPRSTPGTPGPFAFALDGLIADLLGAAGFGEIEVGAVDFAFRASDLDAWWEHMLLTSPTLGGAVKGLSPKDHYELRDAFDAGYVQYVGEDGTLTIPARTLVAAATA
ncbi:MAG TPA: methyltransferase domain-containing protein [Solirubrobacteraceae bacterium]